MICASEIQGRSMREGLEQLGFVIMRTLVRGLLNSRISRSLYCTGSHPKNLFSQAWDPSQ